MASRDLSLIRLRTFLLTIAAICLSSCGSADSETQIQNFCQTLQSVNSGSVDTSGLPELEGHSLVAKTLLDQSPPSLIADLTRIYETVDAWAAAVSGDHPMIETFSKLAAPELIGSEGRVTDFAAEHCGIDLGGPQWVEAPVTEIPDTCPAWPRIGTPLTFNNFPNLPDIAGSNYFGQNFVVTKLAFMLGLDTLKGAFVVEPGSRVVLHGQYPKTRYFAFHPNDMDLNNLATLRDIDLDPDEGSVNPFRTVATGQEDSYFTASLVFSPPPENPASNTTYVGARKDGITDNRFVINMLRMYHVDAGNGPGSGEVPLPSMSIYSASGELVQHYDQCDLFAPGNPELKTEQVFPALPIIDHRPRNPPQWTISSNFDAPSDSMANADAQYLATHYSERFGELFVVRAKYLSAPDTRNGESPAIPGKQVRLYNLCTYNFWNGGASQCVLDNDLRRDEAGFYTVVISKTENRPSNLEANAVTWMNWGPYMDGQLQYRYVYRENPYATAIAAAADGDRIADELMPYVPAAVPCDPQTFERGGWQACFGQQGLDVSIYQ